MDVDVIVVGQLAVNCYIITEGKGSDALIIDPGDECENIREIIEIRKAIPKYLLFTRAHNDHVCAVGDLKMEYNKAALVMHEDEGRTC